MVLALGVIQSGSGPECASGSKGLGVLLGLSLVLGLGLGVLLGLSLGVSLGLGLVNSK